MSICFWISDKLTKLATRLSLPSASASARARASEKRSTNHKLTPDLRHSQTAFSIPTRPSYHVTRTAARTPAAHQPERKDQHHWHYPSGASDATRGWRIPRFRPRRSPGRRDRYSTHCTGAGILFSAVKLRMSPTFNGCPPGRAWNHHHHGDQRPGDQGVAVELRETEGLSGLTASCGVAVLGLNDCPSTHKGSDAVGEHDWNGIHYHPTQCWIPMEPVIGRV